MIKDFQPLGQPPGSKSCLPTAVRAVLKWRRYSYSQNQVSEWCRESTLGCLWSDSLAGLNEEGIDANELLQSSIQKGNELQALRAIVEDVNEPQPVIVTLQEPTRDINGDHAVVVVGFSPISEDAGDVQTVFYMDPLSGTIERDTAEHFLYCWTYADSRAFTIAY